MKSSSVIVCMIIFFMLLAAAVIFGAFGPVNPYLHISNVAFIFILCAAIFAAVVFFIQLRK